MTDQPYAKVRVEHINGRCHGELSSCQLWDFSGRPSCVGGWNDDNAPGPSCPGPGTYALVPIDELPRWVPVEERLPKVDGQYHVFAIAAHCKSGWESKKEYTKANGFQTIGTVIHWLDGMPPLPTPPEAEG